MFLNSLLQMFVGSATLRSTHSPRGALLALVLAGIAACGCNPKPKGLQSNERAAAPGTITQAMSESPRWEPAGLVALSGADEAINLGPGTELELDRGLTNGTIKMLPNSQASGDFEVRGSMRMQPRSTLEGSLKLGGTLQRLPGARVIGEVEENASVLERHFPAARAVAGRAGSFGPLVADVVVDAGASLDLGDTTRRVRRLILKPRSTLVVSGQARVEVLDEFTLGPESSVTVKPGGRLTLLVRGQGLVGAKSRIVQEGQDRAAGLRLFVASTGSLDANAGWQFGPGLIYYPEREGGQPALLRASFVKGAVVCGQLRTTPRAGLQLDARYLRCAFDTNPPRISLERPTMSAEVPPDQASIEVVGVVTDDGNVESVLLTDASGTRPLTIDAEGRFSMDATLRQDGEPTQICIEATDCADRVALKCVTIDVESEIELAITYPSYAERLEATSVSLRGRVTKGRLSAVRAAGIEGTVGGNAFTIVNVPLEVGWNLIDVVGTGSGGGSKTLRIAIARDTLPVRRARLTVHGDVRAELDSVGEILDQNRNALPAAGFVHYQLLDDTSRVLFAGRILGTSMHSFHTDDVELALPLDEAARTQEGIPFLIPAISGARTITFATPFGRFMGRGALP